MAIFIVTVRHCRQMLATFMYVSEHAGAEETKNDSGLSHLRQRHEHTSVCQGDEHVPAGVVRMTLCKADHAELSPHDVRVCVHPCTLQLQVMARKLIVEQESGPGVCK